MHDHLTDTQRRCPSRRRGRAVVAHPKRNALRTARPSSEPSGPPARVESAWHHDDSEFPTRLTAVPRACRRETAQPRRRRLPLAGKKKINYYSNCRQIIVVFLLVEIYVMYGRPLCPAFDRLEGGPNNWHNLGVYYFYSSLCELIESIRVRGSRGLTLPFLAHRIP